jgi:hypothetical protein
MVGVLESGDLSDRTWAEPLVYCHGIFKGDG